MSTVSIPDFRPSLPPLENGERMGQAEFHRRYKLYPGDEKIELVGGIVYVTSPLRWPHATYHEELGFLLGLYRRATPGTDLGHDATAILGEDSEPRPDLTFRILPECGGQSWLDDEGYVQGTPELLAEIALSSRSLDMNRKREDYEAAGVGEYLVLCVEEGELHWFDFRSGRPLRANREGVLRSRVFPGLWVDGPALLARDSARLRDVIEQGLASRDHAAFVQRLQRRQRGRK
jgi:Uma2 family endonuclease